MAAKPGNLLQCSYSTDCGDLRSADTVAVAFADLDDLKPAHDVIEEIYCKMWNYSAANKLNNKHLLKKTSGKLEEVTIMTSRTFPKVNIAGQSMPAYKTLW